MRSNSSAEFGGWNLDDFEIYSLDSCVPPSNYGAGTAGSGGITPTITYQGGLPTLGSNTFEVVADQILGGARTAIFVGFGQASVPVKGVTLLVDLNPFFFLQFRTASGPVGVPGAGARR